jgi:hypothetical protein
MSPGDASTAEIASAACLDGMAFDVQVNRRILEDHLRGAGPLSLAGGSGGGDVHPISCEVWRVTKGRAMPDGVDQLDIVARWARLITRAVQVTWPGADGLVALATATGERATEALALGPYNELLLAVPDVRVNGEDRRYMAVLGMFTDSDVARSIDGWMGYGYDKRPGHFVFEDRGALAVSSGEQLLLAGKFRAPPAGQADLDPAFARRLDDRWAQPLLGGLYDGKLRRSWLRRQRTSADECRVVHGDVHVSLPRALLDGRSEHGAFHAVHAVMFTNVPALISRPERLT